MGKIGADIGLMREAANRMRAAADQFDQSAAGMGRSLETLGTVWAGVARESCLARWGSLAPAFPSGAEALRTYAANLDQIADHLEREARKSWLEKAAGSIGKALSFVGGLASFFLPPLGLGLSIVGGGMVIASAVPDLVRYGDVRGFLRTLSSSAPLPPGVASQVIRTGLEIAADARSLKDALNRIDGMIPGGTDSVLGTMVNVANSKDVPDALLNSTGFFGQNDVVDTAVTVTKIARADNFDQVLEAVKERLPAGAAEALQVIRAGADAENFGEFVTTTLNNLPPGAREQLAAALKGVVPPEIIQAGQTVLGTDPLGRVQAAEQLVQAAGRGDVVAALDAGTQLAGGFVPAGTLPAGVQDLAQVAGALQRGDYAAAAATGAHLAGLSAPAGSQDVAQLASALQRGDYTAAAATGAHLTGLSAPAGAQDVARLASALERGDYTAAAATGAHLAGAPALPEPVHSAAGFLYDTRATLVQDAGRAWSDIGVVDLGSVSRDLPVAAGINGGEVRITLPPAPPVAGHDWFGRVARAIGAVGGL